jgi:hypothetical protein
MQTRDLSVPVSVAARGAAMRYARQHQLPVNLDMLGDIVDVAVAAVAHMIAAEDRARRASATCPFDREDHGGLCEEDVCPVCGLLGTPSDQVGADLAGRCVSLHR